MLKVLKVQVRAAGAPEGENEENGAPQWGNEWNGVRLFSMERGSEGHFPTEKTLEFGCRFLVNSKVIFEKNFDFVFVFFVSVFSIFNF